MVKALFFDLTDTLQEFDWSKQWPLLREVIEEEIKMSIDPELLKSKYQQVYESYRLGWIKSDIDFFDLLFMQMGINVSEEDIKHIVPKHLEIRKAFTWLPQNYKETLADLKKHFKLAVVSSGVANWAYYDFKNIFGFNFKDDFDAVLFSQEKGFLKESGKLFDLAINEFNINPSDAAFVGNDYEDDILMAKEFGLKTIFLSKKNEEQGRADILIKNFRELSDIKEELKAL